MNGIRYQSSNPQGDFLETPKNDGLRRATLLLWWSLWPMFLGVFLPYVPLPGHVRLANLLWGVVDGLGLWAQDRANVLSINSPYDILGLYVWPIAVSLVMFLSGKWLQRSDRRELWRAMVVVLAGSSFLVVNLDRLFQEPFSRLPTYFRFFFVIW